MKMFFIGSMALFNSHRLISGKSCNSSAQPSNTCNSFRWFLLPQISESLAVTDSKRITGSLQCWEATMTYYKAGGH